MNLTSARSVTVSAPGKLHLMGEHAVVYGKPAILTAVSQRLYVAISNQQPTINDQQSIDTIATMRKRDAHFDAIAVLAEKKYQVRLDDPYISVTSSIPRDAGMGSSAAFAAAVVGGLISYLGKPWSLSTINELAFAAEKHMHGNPSGGDNTVVVHGGLLWFRREFEFLKTFWSLPVQFPRQFAPFVLVHTGTSEESTKQMITSVDLRFKNHDLRMEKFLNRIEEETKGFLQSVHDENENRMREAIRQNQRLLERLGVVSGTTKKFIRSIERAGGVAKISGAGGVKGGSGIVICQHDDTDVVSCRARKSGFEPMQTMFAQPGVRVERIIT